MQKKKRKLEPTPELHVSSDTKTAEKAEEQQMEQQGQQQQAQQVVRCARCGVAVGEANGSGLSSVDNDDGGGSNRVQEGH